MSAHMTSLVRAFAARKIRRARYVSKYAKGRRLLRICDTFIIKLSLKFIKYTKNINSDNLSNYLYIACIRHNIHSWTQYTHDITSLRVAALSDDQAHIKGKGGVSESFRAKFKARDWASGCIQICQRILMYVIGPQ